MKNLIALIAVVVAAGCTRPESSREVRMDGVDAGKRMVERPIKEVLAPPARPAVPAMKVRWHGSFEKALLAASKSSKPILLFQLLGNLDEEFC